MKSKYLVAAFALALVACNNDETDNNVVNEPIAARFYGEISEATTRAAGTTWTVDDAIGVTGTSGSTTYTNIKYKYVAQNDPFAVVTSGNEIYYQDGKEVEFKAYYPFSGTEESIPLTVTKTITAKDQDATNLSVDNQFTPQSQIDFLYGTGKGTRTTNEGKVEFAFKHQMSKLILVFIAGNEVDLKGLTQYKLEGLEMSGSFDPTTGTAEATTPSATTTLTIAIGGGSFTIDGNKQASSLILFPQTATTATLTATVGGKTYKATLNLPEKTAGGSNKGMVSGKKYTYNVTVGTQEMIISKAIIEDWTEGITGTDGDVDAIP